MVTTTTDSPKRPRRELSLWPLAMVPLIGALLIGGAILAASHIAGGDPSVAQHRADVRLLDSMQQDVRAVTPAGLHETSLRRHACDEPGHDDSGSPGVERVLRIDGDHKPGAVRTAVLDAYVQQGWQRITFALAVSTDNVKRGDRVLWATESSDGGTLTITESGGSC